MLETGKPRNAGKGQADQPRDVRVAQETIRKVHGCKSEYCRTEHVVVTADSKSVWDGFVMVFELIGHREAECCYACSGCCGREKLWQHQRQKTVEPHLGLFVRHSQLGHVTSL